MQRRTLIAGGVAVAAVVGGLVAWRTLVPAKLGLEQPRVVMVSGEGRVDETKARAALPFAAGATVQTGRGSVCFSLHASRACLGAGGEVKLTDLGPTSGVLELHKGALVVATSSDEVRIRIGPSTVTVRDGIVALEPEGINTVVRALQGGADVDPGNRPAVVVAAPDAISMADGRKRSSVPSLEREERDVAQLARRWQGSAGAVLQIAEAHGRVEVDGTDVGLAPAGLLLDEGSHTFVVRDGAREVVRETLDLRAGQKVVRGG